jgi:hypothetical protein
MRVTIIGAIGLALCLSVSTAEAKNRNKLKTVTGCVEGTAGHYELSTVTKKGKRREYALVGNRDFSAQVGHKIRAHGAVAAGQMKVSSVTDLAPSCK